MIIATVTGNVGTSELKDVRGKAILEFSVASNEKSREGADTTTWVRCSIWEKRATALAQYVAKGTAVTVVGKLTVREYDRKDGSKGHSVEMAVSEIALQGSKRDGAGAGQRSAQPAAEGDGGADFGDDDIGF
jgi:single-strand DNA-binding protein